MCGHGKAVTSACFAHSGLKVSCPESALEWGSMPDDAGHGTSCAASPGGYGLARWHCQALGGRRMPGLAVGSAKSFPPNLPQATLQGHGGCVVRFSTD